MTTTAGTKPHPIFRGGRWVESDDPLVVTNPAHPDEPAGATFNATEAQYEEAGKAIRDSLVEVDRAILTFRLGAEEAERMVGETIPLDLMPASKGRIGITRRFPIGPIA